VMGGEADQYRGARSLFSCFALLLFSRLVGAEESRKGCHLRNLSAMQVCRCAKIYWDGAHETRLDRKVIKFLGSLSILMQNSDYG
jgi:hypothetical protein